MGSRAFDRVAQPIRRALQLPHNILVLITFAIYAAYSVSRYQQFLTAGYDLGIFDQVVRRYSHFQAPIVNLKGPNYNVYGDHFHPILATLAPLYWIWDDPRMLLIAQAALIALGTWIVHRFCARHLTPKIALLVTAAFALGWPIQNLANFDFHEIAFGVPLAAWAIDAVDRRARRELIAACLLLLLVREDLGLVVAVLALVALPRIKLRTTIALVVAGLATYIVTTSIILPHFNPSGTFAYWTYTALGPNAPSALKSLLLHPWHGINLFFTPHVKSVTLLWLFAPVLFLALASPYTLCILPILAERFFSSREAVWGTKYHYSSILWPFVLMGAIDGARRLKLLGKPKLVQRAAFLMIAIPLIGSVSYKELWPLDRAVTGRAFHYTARDKYENELLKLVPHNACVESDDNIASHLTRWDKVSLPTLVPVHEDFIVIDIAKPSIGYGMPPTLDMYLEARKLGYTIVGHKGTVTVFRSPTYIGPSKACSPYSLS